MYKIITKQFDLEQNSKIFIFYITFTKEAYRSFQKYVFYIYNDTYIMIMKKKQTFFLNIFT